MKMRPSGRIHVGKLARRIAQANGDRFQVGKTMCLGPPREGTCVLGLGTCDDWFTECGTRTRNGERGTGNGSLFAHERFDLSNRPLTPKRAFFERRLKRFLERHHQLDPIERAQAELLERGRRADVAARRESLHDLGHTCAAGRCRRRLTSRRRRPIAGCHGA